MVKLALLLALLAPSSVAEPVRNGRVPTGDWSVNFDDAQCLAVRNYGSPANQIQLVLKAPAVGGVVQVAIMRKAQWTPATQLNGWLTIGDGRAAKASFLTYSPKSSKVRVYMINMPAAEFALLRQAPSLSIQTGDLSERFALSDMTPLLKIVDECVADLRRVFNVTDPATAEASPLQRRAKANLPSLFSSYDYPAVALQREQEGRVRFGLLINEDGRVADCSVTETSGYASLDAQVCAVLKIRARFQPALASGGMAAKDAVVGSISWRTQ